eukprot:c25276_g3_i20 orf=1337-1654(+)
MQQFKDNRSKEMKRNNLLIPRSCFKDRPHTLLQWRAQIKKTITLGEVGRLLVVHLQAKGTNAPTSASPSCSVRLHALSATVGQSTSGKFKVNYPPSYHNPPELIK